VQTIDRWRKWRPVGKKLGEFARTEPSKPSEPTFEGFEGTIPGKTQNFSATEQAPAAYDFDPLDELRRPFVEWFNTEVWLDVEWIARCKPGPRWCAGLNALHTACCRWMIGQDQVVPPTTEEFSRLLAELGCAIHVVHGEPLVLGIGLKEDVQAQRSFDDS
jgi:hypothetical protein